MVLDSSPNFDLKSQLDEIQKDVFLTLKPLGFKKKGRTFYKQAEKGIFQIINFQSGRYNDGTFAINLGVCVDKLYKFQHPTEDKIFYKEYECHIRTRLKKSIPKGHNYFWTIDNNKSELAKEVIECFEKEGFEWFSGIDTREKIIKNFGNGNYNTVPRAKLDVALIVWLDDQQKGTQLFIDYFNSIQSTNGHKEYVEDLAKNLGININ